MHADRDDPLGFAGIVVSPNWCVTVTGKSCAAAALTVSTAANAAASNFKALPS